MRFHILEIPISWHSRFLRSQVPYSNPVNPRIPNSSTLLFCKAKSMFCIINDKIYDRWMGIDPFWRFIAQNGCKLRNDSLPCALFISAGITELRLKVSRTNCSRTFQSSPEYYCDKPFHYAPETFKMWSQGLNLLKFDHFTVTPLSREIWFVLNSNGPKMSFLAMLETLNFEFW